MNKVEEPLVSMFLNHCNKKLKLNEIFFSPSYSQITWKAWTSCSTS